MRCTPELALTAFNVNRIGCSTWEGVELRAERRPTGLVKGYKKHPELAVLQTPGVSQSAIAR